MQYFYPFRKYAKDLLVWSLSAEVQTPHQAPAALLQLSGGARELADQIDLQQLVLGVTGDWHDGQGNVAHTGIHLLLKRLGERYGELATEEVIRTLMEFFTFYRPQGEDIDQALTRWDIALTRAQETAALGMSPSVLSFLLLHAFQVSVDRWPVLFMTWGGNFPTTDEHYKLLKANIRQQGHMLEQHHAGFKRLFNHGTGNRQTYCTYYGADMDTSQETPDTTGYGYGHDSDPSFPFPAFPPSTHAAYAAHAATAPAAGQFGPLGGGSLDEAETTGPCDTCGTCGAFMADWTGGDTETDEDDDDGDYKDIDQDIAQYLTTHTPTQAGEDFYEAYIFTRKRWRRFSGRPSRFQRRKTRFNRPKGYQSKGKPAFGKGPPIPFGKTGPRFLCTCCASYEDAEDVYFKGKSSSKGKGQQFGNTSQQQPPRRNPIGKDGKIMTCSGCGSEWHFRRNCSKLRNTAASGSKPGIMYADQHAFSHQPPAISS